HRARAAWGGGTGSIGSSRTNSAGGRPPRGTCHSRRGAGLRRHASPPAWCPVRRACGDAAALRALGGHGLFPAGCRCRDGSVGRLEAPLVGRRLELAQLLEAWSQAREGRPAVTLVMGEPGIGKSRLLRELRREVPSDAWLECRCVVENQSSPLQPFAELLTALPAPIETVLGRTGVGPAPTRPLLARLLPPPHLPSPPPFAAAPKRLSPAAHAHP